MSLKDYQAKTSDWRAQLKLNEKRTKTVIGTFVGIFILVGLLVDTFIGMSLYNAPAWVVFKALISFKLFPYATFIMLTIAVISLLITYGLYDKIMLLGTNARQITANNAQTMDERQLYNVVEEMKVAAGLQYMPKVYLIDADYMNAFASGYSEKSAMVAITRGLITKLNRAELQAVMAHELSHIRHHDIKLTLTVAVLSNILLIAIDVLFYGVLFNRDRRREGGNRLALIIIILRYILPLVTALLTLFLSRTREFMADAGAVELTRDNGPLASALLKINNDHQENAVVYRDEYGRTAHESVRRASYIFDPAKFNGVSSFNDFLSTHPSLEKRLKALGFKKQP